MNETSLLSITEVPNEIKETKHKKKRMQQQHQKKKIIWTAWKDNMLLLNQLTIAKS